MSDPIADVEKAAAPRTSRDENRAAGVALGLFLAFIGMVAVLHFLKPDLSPLATYISDYATGRFGFLMVVAFLALAAGLGALIISLSTASPFGSKPWAALVFLSISALLMVLVALFRSDPPGGPQTTAGEIHDQVSGLFFLSLMVAMLILSVRLWRAGMLAGRYWLLLWLAVAAPVLLVVAFMVLDSVGLVGLGQRIYVLTLLGWLIVMANGLRGRHFMSS